LTLTLFLYFSFPPNVEREKGIPFFFFGSRFEAHFFFSSPSQAFPTHPFFFLFCFSFFSHFFLLSFLKFFVLELQTISSPEDLLSKLNQTFEAELKNEVKFPELIHPEEVAKVRELGSGRAFPFQNPSLQESLNNWFDKIQKEKSEGSFNKDTATIPNLTGTPGIGKTRYFFFFFFLFPSFLLSFFSYTATFVFQDPSMNHF